MNISIRVRNRLKQKSRQELNLNRKSFEPALKSPVGVIQTIYCTTSTTKLCLKMRFQEEKKEGRQPAKLFLHLEK